MRLESPAFRHGAYVPPECTCDGDDVAPELAWRDAPEGTRSFALLVLDPDAPSGTFTHRVLYDVPADARGLPRGDRGVGVDGRNDFQHEGWGGPCPPPNHGDHRYRFLLHALDVSSLGLAAGATRDEVERAMEGHVLDRAELMGRYARRTTT